MNRILLIDDDPLVLRSLSKLLEKECFQVIPCSSYQDALKAFQTNEFDLIVSDIRMPGKNGVETVSEIQSRLTESKKRDLPIIFITGYAEYSAELQAQFVGEILTKPVDSNHLIKTIRDYL